jgi:imidazolonepropionase-like amidohydrolase
LRGAEGPRRGAACLDLGIISDGSVLIRDGRIACVGQSRRVDNLSEARNAIVVEVHGAVVMPAFVDPSLTIPSNATLARRILQRATRRNLAASLRFDLLAHNRDALRLFRSLGPGFRVWCGEPDNPDWIGLALAYGASVLDLQHPLSAPQIRLLADSPAVAVVPPAAAGIARALVDGDAAVAISSGFSMTAGATCSMQAAALLAVRDGGLQLAEAITLSTINAAHALGLSAQCGSLEAGKQADILVLHVPDYHDIVNFMGVNLVSKIVHAGTLVS